MPLSNWGPFKRAFRRWGVFLNSNIIKGVPISSGDHVHLLNISEFEPIGFQFKSFYVVSKCMNILSE